jgi:hypothetical protein
MMGIVCVSGDMKGKIQRDYACLIAPEDRCVRMEFVPALGITVLLMGPAPIAHGTPNTSKASAYVIMDSHRSTDTANDCPAPTETKSMTPMPAYANADAHSFG